MAKRIPTTVSFTTRPMTAEEEKRFKVAIDALIGELVEREVDRRIAERRQHGRRDVGGDPDACSTS